MIESAILRDQKYIRSNPNISSVWHANSSTLKVSTIFMMANSQVYSAYCAYGSGFGSILDPLRAYGTMELESNYPKNFGLYQNHFYRRELLPPKLAEEDRYFPIRLFNNGTSPFINIYYNSTTPFGPAVVKTIKSYLSRGIPLMTGINSVGPDSSHYYIYRGDEILRHRCTYYSPHHLV